MEAIEGLLHWAGERGIQLHGIEPKKIPGRGVGVLATKRLEADQALLKVPTASLRTLNTVPRSISRKLPRDMTVHGLFAADLALDETPKYSEWNSLMPTRAELFASVPLAWTLEAQRYLPKTARDLLGKQQVKFRRDWGIVHAAFPSLAESDYMYAWLLVNTRTFYYTTPKTEKLPRNDRIVLQPVADLFNHADEGCSVSFDSENFTITSNRPYATGEELYVCYGRHGNDFLLAEYGFILAENRWDEVSLDDAILPRLSAAQRRHLEDRGFLGNYKLDANTECYRTEVALGIMCMPLAEWRKLVDGVGNADELYRKEVDGILVEILREYQKTVQTAMGEIKELPGQERQREVLEARWAQIQYLLSSSILRLEPEVAT